MEKKLNWAGFLEVKNLDNKKIAIIIHMTDENVFQETLKSLQTLKVPKNFSVDIFHLL